MSKQRIPRLGLGTILLAAGCGGAETEAIDVATTTAELKNGTIVFPTSSRSVQVNGCSGTMVNDNWVLTAAHCFSTKDPSNLSVRFGSQTQTPTHLKFHYQSKQIQGADFEPNVDVAMLRVPSKFSALPYQEPIIFTGDTNDIDDLTVECYGFGAIDTYGSCTMDSNCNAGDFCQWGVCMVPHNSGSLVRRAYFETKPHAPYPDTGFELEVPNADDQMTLPGDSGGACWLPGLAAIVGVTSWGNPTNLNVQASGEGFGTWASMRRGCAAFDPNNPSTSFCSASCPCDIGEGDCDRHSQCRPGLVCGTDLGAQHGLRSDYDICVRPQSAVCDPPFSFGPDPDYCSREDGCLCTVGEGGCDIDLDCGDSLVCRQDVGWAVGLPENYGVCTYPTAPGCPAYSASSINWGLCTPGCPCGAGDGDCDTDADCRGDLRCAQNRGARVGRASSLDICVHPWVLSVLSTVP